MATKTLRIRTKEGWITKPSENIDTNRLSSIEVDDNFLAIEEDIENLREELRTIDPSEGGGVGKTPVLSIGTVTSGEIPNVTIGGTPENPVLNFTLVPGEDGKDGIASGGTGVAKSHPTTNVLTKQNTGRYKSQRYETPTTHHIVAELESDFLSVSIGVPNIHSESVAGVKVSVAVLDSIASQSWLLKIAPTGSWVDLKFDGSSNTTLPARIAPERASMTFSDPVPLRSIPRTDSGIRPLIMIRIEYPANSVTSIPINHAAGWRYTSSPRLMRLTRQEVLGVTDKASFTNNVSTEMGCVVPAIQYVSKREGRQALIIGDSVSSGVGGSPVDLGAVQMAISRISTPEEPFEWYNGAVHAQTQAVYRERLTDLLPIVNPTLVSYQPWTVNDTVSGGISDVALGRLYTALAKTITELRNWKHDVELILLEGTPSVEAHRPSGANDQKRRDVNSYLNSITGPITISGYADAIGTPPDATGQNGIKEGMSGDGVHPNAVGYSALADVVVPFIE